MLSIFYSDNNPKKSLEGSSETEVRRAGSQRLWFEMSMSIPRGGNHLYPSSRAASLGLPTKSPQHPLTGVCCAAQQPQAILTSLFNINGEMLGSAGSPGCGRTCFPVSDREGQTKTTSEGKYSLASAMPKGRCSVLFR